MSGCAMSGPAAGCRRRALAPAPVTRSWDWMPARGRPAPLRPADPITGRPLAGRPVVRSDD
jgi:hypothetical protein